MRSIRDWVFSWFSVRSYIALKIKKISYLDEKISQLVRQQGVSAANLLVCEARLDKIQRVFDAEMGRAKTAIDSSGRLNKKLDEALDSARTELSTLRELTVPGLVASHQLLIKRAEADTAIQAARSVLASPMREPE